MGSESIPAVDPGGGVPLTNGDGMGGDGNDATDAGPAPERAGPEPEAAQQSTGDVAFAIMRGHHDLLGVHGPAVERSDDPEPLHDLRVDIRRLRAAIGFFADALPARAASVRERLGALGSVLGALRDLDVQSGRVAAWVASASGVERDTLEFAGAVLDQRRLRARRRAVATLCSARTRGTFASLEQILLAGPPRRSSVARTPILELAPELLTHEQRKLVEIGDAITSDSPPEALHAVRIRCKRLRYAVEWFKPWYGKATRAYVRRLVSLADDLGAHQDAVVAAATLRDIGLASERRLGAARLLTLGALAERCLEQARDAHRRFPARFARVSGRRWRRLLRAMDDARPARG